MTLPGGGVGDENPALTVGIFQNQRRGAGKGTRADPRAVALRRVVPAYGVLMVRLFLRHKLHTLPAQDILDMRHAVDARNESRQLGCRTAPGSCSRKSGKIGIAIALLYHPAAVVVLIYRNAALMHVILRLVRTAVLVIGARNVHVETAGWLEHILLDEILVFHSALLLHDHRENHIAQIAVALALARRITQMTLQENPEQGRVVGRGGEAVLHHDVTGGGYRVAGIVVETCLVAQQLLYGDVVVPASEDLEGS